MNNNYRSKVALAIALLLSASCALAAQGNDPKWKTGQILVKPKAGVSDSDLDAIVKQSNGKSKEVIGKGQYRVHIISVPANAEEAVVRALSKNPKIEFAELDMASPPDLTPDDPRFSSGWHLPKIQAPAAWDVSKADGIIVAVLDTGVEETHPDLANQLLPGYNSVDGTNNTTDIQGHGTATAGTVAAQTNNAIGVSSVAWGARILPVRISNNADGWAYWSDVARGLTWAADNGAQVANISYGVSGSSAVTSSAQYLRSKNGLVVAAAGNENTDPGFANNLSIISVSATDSNDLKASWSNFGAFIDVAAPGVSILTTSRGGGYGNWSGTSFASPITAGVVALIKSANPSLTVDDVERILKQSADNSDPNGAVTANFGHGRVNAAKAVSLAKEFSNPDTDTIAPSVSISSPTNNTSVKGVVQVTATATDNVAVASVSLFVNDSLISTDNTAPYQFAWDTTLLADGNAVLKAKAVDAKGNEGVSTNNVVSVKNTVPVDMSPPVVTIVNPANGSRVGRTQQIYVTATDDIAVTKIQLFIAGKLVSTATNATALSYNWNTNKEKSGTIVIDAVATDTAGKATKTSIQVVK